MLRFPKNIRTQAQWKFQIKTKNNQENFDESNALICNWHFEIKERRNIAGKLFLLPNAIPKLNFPNQSTYDNNVVLLEHEHVAKKNMSVPCSSRQNKNENSYDIARTPVLISPFYYEDNHECSNRTTVDTEMLNVTNASMNEHERSMIPTLSEPFQHIVMSPNSIDITTPHRKPRLPRKNTKIRYAGDVDSRVYYSPKTANSALKICRKALFSSRKKIRTLQSKLRRRDNRINSLQTLISKMKVKFGLSEHSKIELKMNFSDEILQQLKKGKRNKEYDENVKAFACTLNFYSSCAYEYVRRTFGKHLPAQSTIKNWYRNVEASPGSLQIALDLLKSKVESDKKTGKKVYVALMLDEMSIRQQQYWNDSKKEWHGLVDFGSKFLKKEDDVVASKALVFLVSSANEEWKLPVAYYFTHSMTGGELASLTRHVIEQIYDTGVVVMSLTFDGPRNNITMAEELGGQLWNYSQLKSKFIHPLTKQEVFLFLDVPHMIKLVRNVLGTKEVLFDQNKKEIKWQYIVELEKLQTNEQLMAGTKLRKRHINFKNEKMKVKLATQTLSDSVADALTYCSESLKLKQFQGSEATIKFIRTFNRLFDILNSQNMTCDNFKKGLCKNNSAEYFKVFDEAKTYITKLTLDKKNLVLNSDSRTGFVGFLTAMESTGEMYKKYVLPTNADFKFLLMHKFSQDPLESTFSVIRAKRGSDDSPNTDHFKGIMKRLLYQNDLKIYSKGTNSLIDDAPFFTTSHKYIKIGSRNKNILKINESIMENLGNYETDDDLDEDISLTELSRYVTDVVVYLSSIVECRLKKQIKCSNCLECLNGDTVTGELITLRANGSDGLSSPQKNIVEVCRIVEKSIRCFNIREAQFYSKLKIWCFRQINGSNIFSNMNTHILDQTIISNHKYLIISTIIDIFLKIRMYHLGHIKKEELISTRIRNKNKKIVQFKGQ